MTRQLLALSLFLIAVPSVLHGDGVDDYVRRNMALAHIPGAAVAVIHDGRLVKMSTYGIASVEQRAPVTPDTRFQIASGTKALTGTALLLLEQEGKLSLEDTVTKYIDGAPEAWKGITLRHLAMHTSGLKEIPDLDSSLTSAEAVRRIAELPLQWEPGTREAYGNSDFTLLAFIIERVTGMSFVEFLQKRLLDPLHMTSTSFDHATESGRVRIANALPNRSGVYLWSDGTQKTYTFLYPHYTYSAGGLVSTIRDLTTWAIAIDREKLLTAQSLETMWTTNRSFAIGWIRGSYRGQTIVGHSGGPALSDILRFPDRKLTVIVLQNQRKLYPYLAQGVADFYLGDLPAPAATTPAGEVEPAMRTLIEELGRGTVDVTRFDAAFLPTLRDYILPYIRSLARPTSLVRVASEKVRVVYGGKAVLWTFARAADGKIQSLEVSAE